MSGPDAPREELREEIDRLRRELAALGQREAERARVDRELLERVKELNCLFQIAQILHEQDLDLEHMLRRIVAVIPPAWKDPDRTCTRIHLDGLVIESDDFAATPWMLQEDLQAGREKVGSIEIGYHAPAEKPVAADPFLDSERRLLRAICDLIENKIVQRQAEVELLKTADELQAQKARLEQKNIALREILEQVELEKSELREQVAANVEQMVMPMLRKVRDPQTGEDLRQRYLEIVEQNLKDLASAYSRRIASSKVRLSPREVEIAVMVRDGFSSKEIAGQLHISALTVERHRHNIRRKMGIAAEKVNLSTYLKQI
jgi:DNA-binding CsgD family transcriptional regulator